MKKKKEEHKPSLAFFLACRDKIDLRSAGYSASDLRSIGYSASDLRSVGCSAIDLSEWDSIPILEKPYTKLLADIKAKKRKHDQSTFGPIQEFDASINLCKTPMCTAGHLVNMAGKVGYELVKKYGGFSQAAALIHARCHPNDPPQNFGAISQELAIAYIEEMAWREKDT